MFRCEQGDGATQRPRGKERGLSHTGGQEGEGVPSGTPELDLGAGLAHSKNSENTGKQVGKEQGQIMKSFYSGRF